MYEVQVGMFEDQVVIIGRPIPPGVGVYCKIQVKAGDQRKKNVGQRDKAGL